MLKERLPEIVCLLILAGLVAGFFLGRRKGRARLQASLAQSRAEGHAEASSAIAAQLHNVVNVSAGNNSRSNSMDEDEAAFIRMAMRLGILGNDGGAASFNPDDYNDCLAINDGHNDSVLGHVEQLQLSGSSVPRIFSLAERDRNAVDRRPDPDGMGPGSA